MFMFIRSVLARFSVNFGTKLGSKLATEVLPAALASLIGGMIFTQVVRPEPPKVAVAAQPAGADMLALLREEHALLTDLLKRDTEARIAANRAADEDVEKLKLAAADRAARLALAKQTPAPSRVVSVAAKETHVPAVQLARVAPETVKPAGEPLQLLALQNADGAPARPPADLVAYERVAPRPQQDGFIRRQVRTVVSTVERVPSFLRDAADWVIGGVTAPKLPDLPKLPSRDFLKAEM